MLTAVWSSNFAAIKLIFEAVPELHVSEYACLRFGMAAFALLPFFIKGVIEQREALKDGLEIGLWITLGYFGQAIGLVTTTANKSAFIGSLNVVWVALVSGLLQGAFDLRIIMCAVLAVTGVGFLELAGSSAP